MASGPPLSCAHSRAGTTPGESATAALTFLGTALDATRFATIDPEEFFDFQSTRPTVRLRDGLTRQIDWPEFEVYEARIPRAPRDLILLSGPEPAIRWRTFCEQVIDLAEALGVQMVTTSARCSPTSRTPVRSRSPGSPRTRRSSSASASAQARYEGPTGIVGVLQAAASDAGLPAASLWAAVPHYVAVVPNPKGALALLRKLETLVGVTVDATELETSAVDYERQVSRAVEMDPDVQAFVERLERAADEEDADARPGRPAVGRPAGARVPALSAPARGGPAVAASRPGRPAPR